jgi:archaellum biogenesis protein FlaJ (TadC family)
MEETISRISISVFGGLAEKIQGEFSFVKTGLEQSDMKFLLKAWISISILAGLVALIGSSVFFIVLSYLIEFDLATQVILAVLSIIIGGGTFAAVCLYPYEKAITRRRSIDVNMPFALNHMAAISASGVPPYVMFKLLTGFGEYGEIAKESQKIVRNVDLFGLSIVEAINEIASRTPSKKFKELLDGIHSNIETGGDLKQFLKIQAQEALFDYRIRREKYIELLSTYADFYTAMLIAAPLFLVAILAVMNMMGGAISGIAINDLMNLGILVGLPALNIIFIAFVNATQPEV